MQKIRTIQAQLANEDGMSTIEYAMGSVSYTHLRAHET